MTITSVWNVLSTVLASGVTSSCPGEIDSSYKTVVKADELKGQILVCIAQTSVNFWRAVTVSAQTCRGEGVSSVQVVAWSVPLRGLKARPIQQVVSALELERQPSLLLATSQGTGIRLWQPGGPTSGQLPPAERAGLEGQHGPLAAPLPVGFALGRPSASTSSFLKMWQPAVLSGRGLPCTQAAEAYR